MIGRALPLSVTPSVVPELNQRQLRSALSIAGAYAALASLWIVVSDLLLGASEHAALSIALIGIAKGLFFVAVTSVALFFLTRAQLQRLGAAEHHVEEVERMRRLGELSARITHDFNNTLHAARTYTQILRRTTTDSRSLPALDQIDAALRRGEALTREILMFAQPQPPALECLTLRNVFAAFASDLQATMPVVEIRHEVTPLDLSVLADSRQLDRLLMNLAVNARDAMPAGGTLTIAARVPRRVPRYADTVTNVAHCVEIIISDTGTGISTDNLPHIFEPQFTTKRTGTGLGLAIVHRIVTDHGGHISASSRLGEGTSISILLPACSPGSETRFA